jgi:hypothetical protein
MWPPSVGKLGDGDDASRALLQDGKLLANLENGLPLAGICGSVFAAVGVASPILMNAG